MRTRHLHRCRTSVSAQIRLTYLTGSRNWRAHDDASLHLMQKLRTLHGVTVGSELERSRRETVAPFLMRFRSQIEFDPTPMLDRPGVVGRCKRSLAGARGPAQKYRRPPEGS